MDPVSTGQRIIWHYRLWSFQGRDTKLERFSTNFYETDVKSNFCQKYQQKTQFSVKCKDHLTTKKVHKWKKIIYFS